MRFSRARYVTLCQQSLVTAAVLAVGVSAAGVKTLDIVPQPGQASDLGSGLPGAQPREALADGNRQPLEAQVDKAPVTPKVREVKVSGISTKSPKAARTAPPSAKPAPKQEGSDATQAPESPKRVVAVSEPEPVRGYATVGATWKHGTDYTDDQIDVTVRTEQGGVWSSWMTAAYHDEHGPDGGSSEGNAAGERPGTDALVVGDVDRVQMRAQTSDGSTPPDLKLAVIDPGTGVMTKQAPAIDTAKLDPTSKPGEDSAGQPQALSAPDEGSNGGSDVQDQVALSAMKTSPRPKIYSRSQWGANERMREQSAPDYGTVKAGFIHHTVNSNNYSSSQVPSLLRGIYAYHTQSRGWRDIGYNYLVDRFGRIWEGRYGGVTRAVVGAHTLGYNEYSFALSAIGNYDVMAPPAAVLHAYEQLFAWKLSLYNIRADNPRVYVKNKYFHAISGHRDAGQTACPGRYLYAKLGSIRTWAQSIQNKAQTAATKPTPPTAFTSPTQTPLAAKAQPTGMTFPLTRNLNAGTNPDLALLDTAGKVSILPNGGQTGYRSAVYTSGTWNKMNLVSAVGDVTGDGKGDVLGRIPGSGNTRVYAGTGDGHVRTTGVALTTAFRSANSVVAARDWDGDGRNDVIMRTNTNSRLWLVRGLGSGKFAAPKQLAGSSWANYTSIAASGDLNRNGQPDLVGLHKNGHLYFISGTKQGTLAAAKDVRNVGTAYTSIMGSGDMTGDGIGDVAARDRTGGGIHILSGNGSGGFGDTLGKFTGATSVKSLSGARMAGSSHSDLVGLDATGTKVVMVLHNGLKNVKALVRTNVTVPGATQLLTPGDWNRDGKHDLITREAGGDRLLLRIGKGNGQYAAGVLMDTGWKPFAYLAAVGDVTGDKNPDLLGAKAASGPFTIFPGNGKASFLAPTKAPSSLRTFNQIGKGSWAPASAKPTYISSDGSFVPVLGSLGEDPSAYNWVVGPGDVDGKGRADLITRSNGGSLWLVPGGDKGFGAPRLIGSGYGAYRLGG